MGKNLTVFEPRQEMRSRDFEIQHKRDVYLKNVELHHHDFYEIYLLESGDVNYVIEGKRYRLVPGDLLLISPRELHQVSIQPDREAYERYVLWIDRAMIQRLSTPVTDLEQGLNPLRAGYSNLLRLTPDQRIPLCNLMETIWQEWNSDAFGSSLLREGLITQLLVQINRLALTEREPPESFVHSSEMVASLVEYVNQHYREKMTLDALAERFFVSKYHLSHEFQRQMGTGVYRYIQKKRLQIARGLLAGGEHPSSVSTSCGFGDYAGFYRAFLAEYGLTPREFARQVRG